MEDSLFLTAYKSSSTPWEERISLGHWKGAVFSSPIRKHVFKCNDPENHRWGVEFFDVKWEVEVDQEGSKLENHRIHRIISWKSV